jgi:hypothetical protein
MDTRPLFQLLILLVRVMFMVGAVTAATMIAHSFKVEGYTHCGCSVASKWLRICPGIGTLEDIPRLEAHRLEPVGNISLVVKIGNHCAP